MTENDHIKFIEKEIKKCEKELSEKLKILKILKEKEITS